MTETQQGTNVAKAANPEASTMKAIVQHGYGSSDVLTLEQVAKPELRDDEILLRVHAAGVNPADWHYMTGRPYLVRLMAGLTKPKVSIFGIDVAGRVEGVGANVTGFSVGDDVFGENRRAYAEYVCVPADGVARKPNGLTHAQAAAMPIAAVTALQGLRDKGKVQSGQTVLINGASGGVGTYAVQIAKAYGAEVTGVCSARNVDMVRSIGAAHVIDYAAEDFTQSDERYDVILDTIGNHSLSELRQMLTLEGTYVSVGQKAMGDWIGPLTHLAKVFAASFMRSQQMVVMLAKQTTGDLATLNELIESGEVSPVIDRTYTLDQAPEALAYQGEGHARGKIVITVANDAEEAR